jgi:hypothetical protein
MQFGVSMAESGAKAAFKGYNSQTLYILHRVLRDQQDLVFLPETNEDLSVFCEGEDKLLEIIQVKDYSAPLVLSNFGTAFFNRCKNYIADKIPIRVISFGEVGPELTNAKIGRIKEKNSILAKLQNEYAFTQAEASIFLHLISFEVINKHHIQKEIKDKIKDLIAAFQEDLSYDLLTQWIFQASENQIKITRAQIKEKIFITVQELNTAHSYLKVINKNVIRIFKDSLLSDENIAENYKKYRDEYFIGMNARKEHIIAGVDVKRVEKLEAINCAFSKQSIVIIHGASGQGKSSLAYRYLYDYCCMPYEIIDYNSSNVNDIISTLIKLANQDRNIQIPIYIDVLPGQKEWINIAKKLYPYSGNFKLLITLREEEWNIAQINTYEFRFAEIPLSFDMLEAKLIYTNFEESIATTKFPSFDDAWRQFGESGPLLEFTFLLAQGDTLRSRLKNQIAQYTQQNIRQLLQTISFAGQFSIPIDSTKLFSLFDFKDSFEFFDIVSKLDREHLIREANNKQIETLHPIRSNILFELLSNELTEVDNIALNCLSVIPEVSFEQFLKNFFYNYNGSITLLEGLKSHRYSNWVGISGTIRALIWLGVKNYVVENSELIKETNAMVGEGWQLFAPMNFMSETDLGINILKDIPNAYKRYNEIYPKFSSRTDVFKYVNAFCNALNQFPSSRIIEGEEIIDLGFTLYWLGFLRITKNIQFSAILSFEFPPEKISYLYYGLYCYSKDIFNNYLEERSNAIKGFQLRYEIPHIEYKDDDEILLYCIQTDNTKLPKGENDLANWTIMERIEIAFRLFPDKKTFSAKAYGFNYEYASINFDAPSKRILKENLHTEWYTFTNHYFPGIANEMFRPANWDCFFNDFKQHIQNTKALINLIIGILKDKSLGQDNADWYQIKKLKDDSKYSPLLPKNTVDKFGGVTEISDTKRINDNYTRALNLEIHRPLLKEIKDYSFSINNFINQCWEILGYSFISKKCQNEEYKKTSNLAFYNLQEAIIKGVKLNNLICEKYSKYNTGQSLELDIHLHLILFHCFNVVIISGKTIRSEYLDKDIKNETDILSNVNSKLLRHLSIRGYSTQIVNKAKNWYFLVNANSIIDYPNIFETFVQKIKYAIGTHPRLSLKRISLQNDIDEIFIIPLYKDKIFLEMPPYQTNLFHLFETDLLNNNPLLTLSYQVSIETIINEFHLACWCNTYNEVKHIQNAILNLNKYWHIVNYFAQISKVVEVIPENTSEGIKVVKEKLVEKALSPLLQNIFDELKAILDILDLPSQKENIQQLYHYVGLKNLTDIRNKLLPTDTATENEIINFSIPMSEVDKWAEKLNKEILVITQSLTSIALAFLAIHEGDKSLKIEQ